MSEFIRSFLISKKQDKESTEKLYKLNETRFARQIEMSKHIPMLKNLFLAFCLLMTILMPILLNKGLLNIEDFSISQEKFTWTGFFLANFMHFQFFHLAMNMLGMIFMFNRFFFANYKILLMVILASMVGSSVFSVYLIPDKGVVIGSSGILFGLLSFYMLYLLDTLIKYKAEGFDVKRIKKFLLIQFTLCVIINFIPFVAWYAHLGGAIMGTLFYFIVRNKLDFSYASFVLTYYKI